MDHPDLIVLLNGMEDFIECKGLKVRLIELICSYSRYGFQIRGSTVQSLYNTLCLGSIEIDCVISEIVL